MTKETRFYSRKNYTKVLNLHKTGLGCRRIGKETGIPIKTIYNWLYKGVKPRKISEKYNIWQRDEKKLTKAIKKSVRSRLKSKKFWDSRKIVGEKLSKKIPKSIKQPSKELAYILGALHGDGTIGKTYLRLKVKDRDFAIAFGEALLKWSGCSYSFKINKEDLYEIRFYSTLACQFLSSINLDDIKKWNFNEKRMFLRGLYDSEGSVGQKSEDSIKFYNSNKKLITLVSALLKDLGINYSIISRKSSKGEINGHEFIRKRNYQILITNYKNKKRFYKHVGFSIKRKQNKLLYLNRSPKSFFITDGMVQKMKKLRKNGRSYRRIAQEFNVNYATIWYHLNKDKL